MPELVDTSTNLLRICTLVMVGFPRQHQLNQLLGKRTRRGVIEEHLVIAKGRDVSNYTVNVLQLRSIATDATVMIVTIFLRLNLFVMKPSKLQEQKIQTPSNQDLLKTAVIDPGYHLLCPQVLVTTWAVVVRSLRVLRNIVNVLRLEQFVETNANVWIAKILLDRKLSLTEDVRSKITEAQNSPCDLLIKLGNQGVLTRRTILQDQHVFNPHHRLIIEFLWVCLL